MTKSKKAVISLSAICLALIVTLFTVVYFVSRKKEPISNIVFTYSASEVDATISGEYAFTGDENYTSVGDAVSFSESAAKQQSNLNGLKFTTKNSCLVCRLFVKNNSETDNILLNTIFDDIDTGRGYKTAMAFTEEKIGDNKTNTIIGGNVRDAVVLAGKSAYVYFKVEVVDTDLSYNGQVEIKLEQTTNSETESQGILRVGEVIERGRYPQSFVGKSLNSELLGEKSKGTLVATGKIFHTEINKVVTACPEYIYEGEKYVYVDNANFYGDDGKFSTGETFFTNYNRGTMDYYDGARLFFKVEPIKFKVMEFTETTMLLDSVSALGSVVYGKSFWANSNLESFLNSTFLSESGLISYATQTSVKNSLPGKFLDGTAPDTLDYIWIASFDDLKRWYPTQNIQIDFQDPPLVRPDSYEGAFKRGTDFAYATDTPIGADFTPNHSTKKVSALCSYNLRTPGNSTEHIFNCGVSEIGSLGTWGEGWYSEGLGFCPIFVQTL